MEKMLTDFESLVVNLRPLGVLCILLRQAAVALLDSTVPTQNNNSRQTELRIYIGIYFYWPTSYDNRCTSVRMCLCTNFSKLSFICSPIMLDCLTEDVIKRFLK